MQFVEIDSQGESRNGGYAPYLDYRPLTDARARLWQSFTLPDWLRTDLEEPAMEYAAIHLVPDHLVEVRRRKEELIDKTMAAVQDRLTKEINYWDHRAAQLKDQELAGRINAKLNSGLARQRADDLAARLQKRAPSWSRSASSRPCRRSFWRRDDRPGGIAPQAPGPAGDAPPTFARDTERSERLAMGPSWRPSSASASCRVT